VSLILSLLCLVLGIGFVALVQALAEAPEGIESETGFNYQNGSRQAAGVTKSEDAIGQGVSRVHGARAA
jgi:hypothetical protein